MGAALERAPDTLKLPLWLLGRLSSKRIYGHARHPLERPGGTGFIFALLALITLGFLLRFVSCRPWPWLRELGRAVQQLENRRPATIPPTRTPSPAW